MATPKVIRRYPDRPRSSSGRLWKKTRLSCKHTPKTPCPYQNELRRRPLRLSMVSDSGSFKADQHGNVATLVGSIIVRRTGNAGGEIPKISTAKTNEEFDRFVYSAHTICVPCWSFLLGLINISETNNIGWVAFLPPDTHDWTMEGFIWRGYGITNAQHTPWIFAGPNWTRTDLRSCTEPGRCFGKVRIEINLTEQIVLPPIQAGFSSYPLNLLSNA